MPKFIVGGAALLILVFILGFTTGFRAHELQTGRDLENLRREVHQLDWIKDYKCSPWSLAEIPAPWMKPDVIVLCPPVGK